MGAMYYRVWVALYSCIALVLAGAFPSVVPSRADAAASHNLVRAPANEVIRVSPGGTGDYPTIQAAIDAASDGDIIELDDGTYSGDGNRSVDFLGKGITVRSASGDAEACIIDADGTADVPHRGFIFRSGESRQSVLEGVTVTGGYVEDYGGGILIDSASPKLVRCVIEGNLVDTSYLHPECFGAGIAVRSSPRGPEIRDCLIRDNGNTRNVLGGALFVAEGSSAILRGTHLRNNSAFDGGGVFGRGARLTLVDCEVSGNLGDTGGGGLSGGTIFATRARFERNQSYEQVGGAILGGGSLLTDCTFAYNHGMDIDALRVGDATLNQCMIYGSTWSGGIEVAAGHLEMLGCVVAQSAGVGIVVGASATTRIVESTITSNTGFVSPHGSDWTAGGVHVRGALELVRSIVVGNCWIPLEPNDVAVAAGGSVSFEQCIVDPAEVAGDGSISYIGSQVGTLPLFCSAADCPEGGPYSSPFGDYHLDAGSPGLPQNNPFGVQVGAFGRGCRSTVDWPIPVWEETHRSTVAKGSGSVQLEVGRPFPNPWIDDLTLAFRLPHADRVRVDLFSLDGRHLARLTDAPRPPGTHSLMWQSHDLPDMEAGVYVLRFSTSTETESRPVVLLK